MPDSYLSSQFIDTPPPTPTDELINAIEVGQVLVDRGVVTCKKINFHGVEAMVKYGRHVRWSEAFAMEFVHKHAPKVPLPRVLGVYQTREEPILFFIVSEWIPGQGLDTVWPMLSRDEKDNIFEQLRGIVLSLRQLPFQLQEYPSFYVGGVNHTPCTDPILFDQGPFADVPAMNAALTEIARPHFQGNWLPIVQRLLCRTNAYRIVFTHGDLHLSNILVRQSPQQSVHTPAWTIAGLVDWECAGWYPEHWEYVKILSSVKWRSDWAEYAPRILDRYYDEELLLDNRLRRQIF